MKISKDLLKKSSPFVFVILIFFLLVFLVFGLALSMASIKNIGYKFSLTNSLFIILGFYFSYEVVKYLLFLNKNKKNFEKLLAEFIKKNEMRIYSTSIISAVLLFIYYFTEFYLQLKFILTIILYLPIFLLNNFSFIVVIYLKAKNLDFLTFIADIILPASQIYYIFKISGLFFKKRKGLNKKKI